MSLKGRFWEKVDRRGPHDCWLWTAYKNIDGYGRLRVGGRSESAHRVSYELNVGPITDGMCVCHSCDMPACQNPRHLFLGSQSENIADMMDKGRRADTRGEKHPRAKLTEKDVLNIRKVYSYGLVKQAHLGVLYNVTRNAIHDIIKRKRWSHL